MWMLLTMCRTKYSSVDCIIPEGSLEKVINLAKAIIDKEKPDMVVEPFACGGSFISSGLLPAYKDKIIFHLTDIRMDIQIRDAISAKVEYESLVPWLLDKKCFIYCDPPHDNFDLARFYSLIGLLQHRNYVIIRSLKREPPPDYKEFGDGCYIQENSLLDNWIKENNYDC